MAVAKPTAAQKAAMEKAAAAKAAMDKASQAALCQETAATEEAGQAALPTAAKGTEAEKEAVAEKEALAETLPDALATDAAASLAVTLATPVASPVAVALPGSHGDVQCCTCREAVPRDKCTCVNKGRLTTKCGDFQWRCRTCGATISRINRLKGGMFDAEGYKDLSIEERQKLMAEGSSLYGGQLAAKLAETISKSRMKNTLNNMNAACPKIEGVRCKLAAPDAADAVPRHFAKKLDDGWQELLDTKKLADEDDDDDDDDDLFFSFFSIRNRR